MIEQLLDAPIVVDVLWQTSLWLVIGLTAAHFLYRRPARAHGVLVVCILAAIITPWLSTLLRAAGWGLLSPLSSLTDAQGTPPLLPPNLDNQTTGALTVVSVIGLIWLVVSMLLTARLAVPLWRSRRLMQAVIPVNDDAMLGAAADAAAFMNLLEAPTLWTSEHVDCPVIWCWSRTPRILLPTHFTMHDRAELHAVLCHEIAHFKRRDHWWSLLAELATCMLPWHPLAWIARRRTAACSEQACDTWALSSGASPTAFAESLLALVPQRPGRFALAAVSDRAGLAHRIERILESNSGGNPSVGRTWLVALSTLVLTMLSTVALAHRAAASPPTTEDDMPIPTMLVTETDPAWGVTAVPGDLDLGVVNPDETGQGEVWLVNRHSEPVRIASARASCGCTAIAADFPAVLAPGASMRIEITMTPSKKHGERKTKFVTFNIDGQPSIKLPVHLATATQ